MMQKVFSDLTPKRRTALALSVLWFTAIAFLLYPFVLRNTALPWPPWYALVVLSLNSISGATILVEFLRAKVSRLSRINDEKHFFWVSVFAVLFLALGLVGYLMMVRSFES